MVSTRHATVCITLLLMLLPLAATTAKGDAPLNILVTEDSVAMNYRVELRQNLTNLPVARVLFDSSNSSEAAGPVEAAIQKLVPGAHLDVSQFKLSAKTELVDAAMNMWKVQVNMTLAVTGVRSSTGGTVSYRLDFLSMNISDSIRAANFEFNQVGRTYLLQPLLSQPEVETTYFLNGGIYSKPLIPSLGTEKFNLLDFSWVPILPDWSHMIEPFSPSSAWTFNPTESPRRTPPYNLTLGFHPVEATFLKFYVAVYSPTLELTAPARAWSETSTVKFDLPTSSDVVMPLIIAASLALGVGSYLVERRLSRTPYKKRRR